MEGKRRKKRQLTWRILKNIFLVLGASMILSAFVGYFYFAEVVREQKIADERSKLQQVANQISFMMEDIEKFADSIIVDDTLQNLLENETFDSEFERLSNGASIASRLVFYNSLRTYIKSSMMVMADGTSYGSSYSVLDEGYVEDKLKIKEVEEYVREEQDLYSNPYSGKENGDSAVICYQVEMWDKHHYGELQGKLYLEVYMKYFLEQIRDYAREYDSVCLIGNHQKILYGQDPEGIIQSCLLQKKEVEGEESRRIAGGYLICDMVGNSGWMLCNVITDEYLQSRSRFVLHFFSMSFLLSMALILVVTYRVIENMIRPVTDLSVQMESIASGKWEKIESVQTGDEIQTLYECFQNMMEEIQKGEQERLQFEHQTQEMEFDVMLSQINPHYIYNVLNTVVYMAAANKQDDIVKIVKALIFSLQETLNMGEDGIETTVAKELELTQCYLEIQKYRYPQMFSAVISCPEELKACIVPKTIIQPLVENAIIHGILAAGDNGKVQVSIEKVDEELHILVEDDGIGIDSEQIERFYRGEELVPEKKGRKHIGVSNVKDRIHFLYRENYGMELSKGNPSGTRILLRLPLKFEKWV